MNETDDADDTDDTVAPEVRRAVAGRARLALLAACAVVAATTAAATAGADIDDVALRVQAAVSVPLPLLGVLLAADVRRDGLAHGTRLLRQRATAAALVAVGVAFLALAIAALAAEDPEPAHLLLLLPGCVTVQLVSQGIGFGLGLLIRPHWLAMLVDAGLPVGLWALAGQADLTSLQHWAFPYDSVTDLVALHPRILDWTQEGVVTLLWVGGTVVAGWLSLRRGVAGND